MQIQIMQNLFFSMGIKVNITDKSLRLDLNSVINIGQHNQYINYNYLDELTVEQF